MKNRASKLTTTGLFAAMIVLMTAYICHIPYGANAGYIHFGDALIYLAAAMDKGHVKNKMQKMMS